MDRKPPELRTALTSLAVTNWREKQQAANLADLLRSLPADTRRRGVGGAMPVRFPSEDDPGDAGRHIDVSFLADDDWWANVCTRECGLLALFLFTDVDESTGLAASGPPHRHSAPDPGTPQR